MICMLCSIGAVEIEEHFIYTCPSFSNIHEKYKNMLGNDSMIELFVDSKIKRLGELLIQISR